MSKLTDPVFLKKWQQRDSSNLSKRASFYQKFCTNPEGWQKWLWGKLELPSQAAVLELGSGPGYFWRENQKKRTCGVEDLYYRHIWGMLKESRAFLSDKEPYSYLVVDALEIPFPGSCSDLVIANHMPHHRKNIDRSFAEIQRVLAGSGVFCAAGNYPNQLNEIFDLDREFFGQEH